MWTLLSQEFRLRGEVLGHFRLLGVVLYGKQLEAIDILLEVLIKGLLLLRIHQGGLVLLTIREELTKLHRLSEELNQFLTDLCLDWTKLIVYRNGCDTFECVTLKPHRRVWYHFLKTRLIPSTQNSTISKERLLVLCSIMMGRNINVGSIIFREVHHYSEKNFGILIFLSLITTICYSVKVPI
ncbi:hypothetical protein J1N35_014434 [Gossypium stocksii]|uniref:Putative plant transposon protein domain-containing protein n=1 Tax=Gossypium stocksii TaxID=47602 RepID=A0A9D3VVJ8_9ROSI|nr:hypothetical protein J1N35_014434 [Gossypium stocksii]